MTTITINTYDPEARFNMSGAEAKDFFAHVQNKAVEAGFDVAFTEASSVDETSEAFVATCFENY